MVEALAIGARVERVWQALTSPRDLGMITLGRNVMEARPGARFRWHWGVFEKVVPAGKGTSFAWEGTVVDVVPGSTLVLGPYPLTTLTVKGEGDAALVTVVQAPAATGDSEDYEEGWADFLLKLKTYLETRHWERDVLARVLVKGTPRRVLGSLLDEKAMKKILPGKIKSAAKTGKKFSWSAGRAKETLTGTFLEIQKNRRLRFTWEATKPISAVTIEAQPMAYGTLVSVHHAGLGRFSRSQLFRQRMFWVHLLERLRCYHQFGGKIKAAV